MLTIDKMANGWSQALKSFGFRRHTDGGFRRHGLITHANDRWMTFEQHVSGDVDVLVPPTDQLGSWKLVNDRNKLVRHELQLPTAILARDSEELESEELESEDNPGGACLKWVLASSEGQLPSDWQGPSRKAVEAWIPQGALSVQRGPFAVQGVLVCEPQRLKVSFPLAHVLWRELSDNRRAWLRHTLLDAHNRWRLARIVLREERERMNIAAEVDLTGAPHVVVEELFTVSLDALRWVVSWLICPVGLLADPAVVSRVWELPPEELLNGGTRNERS